MLEVKLRFFSPLQSETVKEPWAAGWPLQCAPHCGEHCGDAFLDGSFLWFGVSVHLFDSKQLLALVGPRLSLVIILEGGRQAEGILEGAASVSPAEGLVWGPRFLCSGRGV